MCERLFVLLLRCYPAGLRLTYGDDALQLMRDRARHERGLFLRTRLLMDLAIDLVATSLHGWQSGTPVLASAHGLPRFESLGGYRPRSEALAVGTLAAMLMFAGFALLFVPEAQSGRSAPTGTSGGGAPIVGSSRSKVQASARAAAFDAIVIRPAQSATARDLRLRVLPNGDIHARALPVMVLVQYAYDLPFNPSRRFVGAPGGPRYDIDATARVGVVPPGLPDGEWRRRTQAMLRGLLADRFGLVIRVEEQRMPVYVLSVARGGPFLEKSTIGDEDCFFDTAAANSCHSFVAGRGHPLNGRAVTMDDLARYIENWADLPVVNRTGLTGLFAVETEGWKPLALPPPPPGNPRAPEFEDLPTIFSVLSKLGLELTREDATVRVYTVDRLEHPAGE